MPKLPRRGILVALIVLSALFAGCHKTTVTITSPLTATGQVGLAFSYLITATGDLDTFAVTGLPSGLSVNSEGVISGTPTVAGVSQVELSATSYGGEQGTATLVLTIQSAIPSTDVHLYICDGESDPTNTMVNHRLDRCDDMAGTNWTTYTGPTLTPLVYPYSVFVDGTGAIYMIDTTQGCVSRMTDMQGTGWTTYGTVGSGTGQFSNAAGIALDSSGRIYIADAGNNRIVRIDNISGSGWTELGSLGQGVNQFQQPIHVYVATDNRIYISDFENGRLVRINDMTGAGWTTLGTSGSGTGQFLGPSSAAVDSLGQIYVADQDNNRIVRVADMTGTAWTTLGTMGNAVNQFYKPRGLYVSRSNHIYITDCYNARVVRCDDMTGQGWTALGSPGLGANQFTNPTSIFVFEMPYAVGWVAPTRRRIQ